MAWNDKVPQERRIETAKMTKGRPAKPTHVVCHITGTEKFEDVKKRFVSGGASAHYLVDKAGLVYQFVEEDNQAWHAGIDSKVQALYAEPPAHWRKYIYYFDWHKHPAGAPMLGGDLKPVKAGQAPVFVARADGHAWPEYDYFGARWGQDAGPVNYAASKKPNAYSVGIEILSIGHKTAAPEHYTEAMYQSLRTLIADICARHQIPMAKGTVLGHEDVNPVQRYGWDPNQGFDWKRVWQ